MRGNKKERGMYTEIRWNRGMMGKNERIFNIQHVSLATRHQPLATSHYSTVTLLARLRGLSISRLRRTAV